MKNKLPSDLLATLATLLLLSTLNLQPSTCFAQGTAFTYQGRLNAGGSPATGIYDLRFAIYDAGSGGSAVAGPVTNSATGVTNGLFCVTLDFGSGVFTGPNRWLEIAARTNGAASFTPLAPRQALTPSPYAVYSVNAGSATTATTAASVPASGIGAGTANINISGNALSAAYAGTAAMAYTATAATTATTATNLTGNVSDAQLPATVARLNGTNNFTGTNTFAGVTIATNVNNVIAGIFLGNGGGLTNLNTAQFANSVLTNGQTGVTLSGAFSGSGANVTNVNAAALNGLNATNFWQTGGNNTAAGQFLGSTNNQPLELWVNNRRALRLEPVLDNGPEVSTVNVVGGSRGNRVVNGVRGATIAGGGAEYHNGSPFGANVVGADYATVGGGVYNSIQTNATAATIAGGELNVIQTNADHATIGGGGSYNTIQTSGHHATIGGGYYNTIQTSASYSAIGGGYNNTIQPNATYSTIGGGCYNTNGGSYSAVPGGDKNYAWGQNSFAAGHRAKANYTGDFVWADMQDTDFSSTDADQFLIRATGGVGINKNNPAAALDVNGVVNATGITVNGSPLTSSQWTTTGGNIYYNTGNVGIGTTSPLWPLDIQAAQSIVRLTTTTSVNGSVLEMKNSTGSPNNLGVIQFNNSANGYPGQISYTADNNLIFQVNSAERMRIASSGNVGIGNTSPGNLLVVGSSGSPAYCNGTTWVNGSDRNSKEAFAAINPRTVLEKVSALPITEWKYKAETDGTRHLGPVAQDFHAAFGLNGTDDKHIATVDEEGVALAAIQGLNQKVEEQRVELNAKDAAIQALEQRLAALEKLVKLPVNPSR